MSIANKRTVLFSFSAGVWLAASILAVALVYELNRPLHEGGSTAVRVAPLTIALLAASWLAFASIASGWSARLVRQSRLIYARARRHP
jgi:hypothetical protein